MTTVPQTPSFGDVLRRHRLEAGLTQEALAERARLSARAISDLERGARHAPHRETVRLLADALQLDAIAWQTLEDAADRARLEAAHRNLDEVRPESNGGSERAAGRENKLVGRAREMEMLRAKLNAALAGRGGVVMIAGEPGIGKSALCRQLATYASVREVRVLAGHCYEDGILSVPYLPFVEALRGYVLSRDPEELKQDLGVGAGGVARLVPEVGARLHIELNTDIGDPADARFRLLQAVRDLLANASKVQPLLLVLEDLHGADRETLNLLVHLARNLSDTRLLIVGTYRDTEVDRTHPLSTALAGLHGSGELLRLALRGLGTEDVQRMLAAVSQHEVPRPFAELVHEQTEGNPLFVQEMLRYLVEERLVEWREGRLRHVGGDSLAGRTPGGLRDVIGRRLARLSPATNQMLSVAAVIGREFRFDVLPQVANPSETELDGALAEAMAAAVIEERSVVSGIITYRFTHALFRQTLSEEIVAPRRNRLHQQVARALESVYSRRLEEYAAELAKHYAFSPDPAGLAKALAYSELAAKRAFSVYAYGEAAGQLQRALQIQDVLDPENQAKRCDLLTALAEALIPAGEPRRVVDEVAPAALKAAEALGDHGRASRAAGIALFAIGTLGEAYGPQWRPLAEVADRHAAPNTWARARADLALAMVNLRLGRISAGADLYARGLELARGLNDPDLVFYAAFCNLQVWMPERSAEHLRLAEEFAMRSRAGVTARTLGLILDWCARVFLCMGNRERAEELWREAERLSTRAHDPLTALRPFHIAGLLATLDGRLGDGLTAAAAMTTRAEQIGAPRWGELNAHFLTLRALLLLLHGADAPIRTGEDLVVSPGTGGPLCGEALWALWLAHLGRRAEAQQILGTMAAPPAEDAAARELDTQTLALLLETAVLLEDRQSANLLMPRLAGVASCVALGGSTSVIARHLGRASALLGDREAARRYYEQALEVAGKLRFRPEMALIRLQLAELPREDGDKALRSEALQHLDFAIAEFREMKMQPALERALRHREVLKA